MRHIDHRRNNTNKPSTMGVAYIFDFYVVAFWTLGKAYNFIKKRLQHRSFPLKLVKFLRTSILKNICKQRLLQVLLRCSIENASDLYFRIKEGQPIITKFGKQ